jgi:hypothetical protein
MLPDQRRTKLQMGTGAAVNKQISCEKMLPKTKECVQMDIGRRKKILLITAWVPNREPASRFPWAIGGERRKHVVAWQACDRCYRFRVRPDGVGPTLAIATASSHYLFR